MSKRQPRPLTAAQQFLNLRLNPISPGSGALHAGRLIWRCSVAPTPVSRSYDLRIDYRQGETPRTYIDSPNLVALAEGRRLPHVYEQQQPTRLCLYLPGTGEWTPALRLDQTIVPWATLWLYFFEDWLVSGDWKGGGKHPDPRTHRRHRTTRNNTKGMAS
jgi:hypothetical protein